MAVNLSPVGGVAAQFFTNTGAVLTGGKLYTYAAGTTTPQVAYTTSQGNVPWTNPIVLDAAGRVPSGGEIWITDGLIYKFVLKDANDVLIATYDNITGINSNAVAYTNQQEIVTATAGQTVFNLGINYQPGTNSLSVFVDGVNQYGPSAQYSYVETSSTSVTFNNGLHVGAEVKFTTTQQQGAGAVDASQVSYNPPFTGGAATNVEAKLAQTVSVLDFGADPTGATDSSAAFQAALNLAKGANGTGVGREVFSIYVPSVEGGFYRIENTLTIDGTHGLVIYGDGALTQRNNKNATIRWYGAGGQPIFNVRGQTGTPSNPNFMITFRDLTMNGYQSNDIAYTTSLPSNYALAGIYIGPLSGSPDNTLLRGAIIENCMISNCRFGIYSGSPTGLNTDHAIVDIKDCNLFNHTQAGIWWGTGNAIATVSNCSIDGCGWTNDQTNSSDVYATSRGANIYLDSGSMDIYSYVGSGAGSSKPKSADIYQQSGRISIINSWSDTHGLFFKQASASQIAGTQYQVAQITGIRHWEGSMDATNTPDSIDVCAPGTSVVSCSFFGNVRLTSGLGGRPICMGINFGRAGATFVGTGVDTQRSLIHHGNKGNFAQSFYGGFNAGRDQFNTVDTGPTTFVVKGDNPGIMEVANAGPAGTNMVWLSNTDDADNSQTVWYFNCYYEVAAGGWVPLQNTKACWRITFGGGSLPLRIQVADPNGTSTALVWTDIGGWITGASAGYKTQANFVPPKLASDPTFNSGNYWLGGLYYNTTTNKLRVNVGGMTWQDCN